MIPSVIGINPIHMAVATCINGRVLFLPLRIFDRAMLFNNGTASAGIYFEIPRKIDRSTIIEVKIPSLKPSTCKLSTLSRALHKLGAIKVFEARVSIDSFVKASIPLYFIVTKVPNIEVIKSSYIYLGLAYGYNELFTQGFAKLVTRYAKALGLSKDQVAKLFEMYSYSVVEASRASITRTINFENEYYEEPDVVELVPGYKTWKASGWGWVDLDVTYRLYPPRDAANSQVMFVTLTLLAEPAKESGSSGTGKALNPMHSIPTHSIPRLTTIKPISSHIEAASPKSGSIRITIPLSYGSKSSCSLHIYVTNENGEVQFDETYPIYEDKPYIFKPTIYFPSGKKLIIHATLSNCNDKWILELRSLAVARIFGYAWTSSMSNKVVNISILGSMSYAGVELSVVKGEYTYQTIASVPYYTAVMNYVFANGDQYATVKLKAYLTRDSQANVATIKVCFGEWCSDNYLVKKGSATTIEIGPYTPNDLLYYFESDEGIPLIIHISAPNLATIRIEPESFILLRARPEVHNFTKGYYLTTTLTDDAKYWNAYMHSIATSIAPYITSVSPYILNRLVVVSRLSMTSELAGSDTIVELTFFVGDNYTYEPYKLQSVYFEIDGLSPYVGLGTVYGLGKGNELVEKFGRIIDIISVALSTILIFLSGTQPEEIAAYYKIAENAFSIIALVWKFIKISLVNNVVFEWEGNRVSAYIYHGANAPDLPKSLQLYIDAEITSYKTKVKARVAYSMCRVQFYQCINDMEIMETELTTK